MTRTMKLMAVLALLGAAGCSEAQAAQASSSYNCPQDATPFGARTDGLCFDKTYKDPVVMTNGQPDSLRQSPNFFEDFAFGDGKGFFSEQSDGTIRDTTALSINVAYFQDGVRLQYWANVAETIDMDMDATGLDIGGDQTSGDGFTLQSGRGLASGRPFYPGVDPAFHFCATLQSTDIDGSDRLFIGFVANDSLGAAPAAALGTYKDFAGLGYNTAADPAVIKTQTSTSDTETVTSLSTTTPNVTLDDSVDMKFCVYVSATRAVTYKIDGVTDADAPAFSFAAGSQVFPTIFYLQSANLADEILLKSWEQGLD